MTDDERDILIHTVIGLTLLMERLGQHDLSSDYGKAIGDQAKRVMDLKKQRGASPQSVHSNEK